MLEWESRYSPEYQRGASALGGWRRKKKKGRKEKKEKDREKQRKKEA